MLSPSALAGTLRSIHARRRSPVCRNRTVLRAVSDEASSDELSKLMMERLGHRALPPRLMHHARDVRRFRHTGWHRPRVVVSAHGQRGGRRGERVTSTDGGAASWLPTLRACMRGRGGGRRDNLAARTESDAASLASVRRGQPAQRMVWQALGQRRECAQPGRRVALRAGGRRGEVSSSAASRRRWRRSSRPARQAMQGRRGGRRSELAAARKG